MRRLKKRKSRSKILIVDNPNCKKKKGNLGEREGEAGGGASQSIATLLLLFCSFRVEVSDSLSLSTLITTALCLI